MEIKNLLPWSELHMLEYENQKGRRKKEDVFNKY